MLICIGLAASTNGDVFAVAGTAISDDGGLDDVFSGRIAAPVGCERFLDGRDHDNPQSLSASWCSWLEPILESAPSSIVCLDGTDACGVSLRGDGYLPRGHCHAVASFLDAAGVDMDIDRNAYAAPWLRHVTRLTHPDVTAVIFARPRGNILRCAYESAIAVTRARDVLRLRRDRTECRRLLTAAIRTLNATGRSASNSVANATLNAVDSVREIASRADLIIGRDPLTDVQPLRDVRHDVMRVADATCVDQRKVLAAIDAVIASIPQEPRATV